MKATFRESRSSLAITRRARCLQARPNQRPQRRLCGDPSAYAYNYLIDVEHAIIVDVEATPARTYDEVASTKTMLERTEQRLDLRPGWLAADTTYVIGKMLAWLLVNASRRISPSGKDIHQLMA